MQKILETIINNAIEQSQYATLFSQLIDSKPHLERTKDKKFGDFSSNIALRLGKKLKRPPLDIANEIANSISKKNFLEKIIVEGPGFINFYISDNAYHQELIKIINASNKYGLSNVGKNINVMLEYVSANPTGPLHVGHGRHAAYGASVANLLKATGHNVFQEYYINDAGRQIDILTISVILRYLEINKINVPYPNNAYQGKYIVDIARAVNAEYNDSLTKYSKNICDEINIFNGDEESLLDHIIVKINEFISSEIFNNIKNIALELVTNDIKKDLNEFGVKYDRWYSEKNLTPKKIKNTIAVLEKNNYVYKKDGAKWFKSSDLGDEKDRVLIKKNGSRTYFASDIAYHLEKIQRGFNYLVNIFGADHHGYAPRIKASLEALGQNKDIIEINIVQFVALYRGATKTQMSTRSGKYITLRELRNEVGNDAARFFYIFRSNDQHLNFDLELAKTQTNDNPVYYIQYAYARISSLLNQADIAKENLNETLLSNLCKEAEQNLMVIASKYPEIIESSSANRAPHQLAHYLRDLAAAFHTFYNSERILCDNSAMKQSRLFLCLAIKIILKNGLSILGVSAPKTM